MDNTMKLGHSRRLQGTTHIEYVYNTSITCMDKVSNLRDNFLSLS